MRRAFGDYPAVQLDRLPVPEHLDRLLVDFDCLEQTTVVPGAKYHFTVRQQLHRLRTLGPPDNLVLDGVEFCKCSLHACLGIQHLIDVLYRDPVGNQGPFHVWIGTFFQCALAWKFHQVKYIRHLGRFDIERVATVTKYGRIGDLRNKAGGYDRLTKIHTGRGSIGRWIQCGIKVDFFNQSLVAQRNGRRCFCVE